MKKGNFQGNRKPAMGAGIVHLAQTWADSREEKKRNKAWIKREGAGRGLGPLRRYDAFALKKFPFSTRLRTGRETRDAMLNPKGRGYWGVE